MWHSLSISSQCTCRPLTPTRVESALSLCDSSAGRMLRSEAMTLCQLIDRNDAARTIIAELGEVGIMQFRDMNGETPLYKRAFSLEMKRCDDLSRRLGFLYAQLEAAEVVAPPAIAGKLLMPLATVEAALRQAQGEFVEARAQETQVRRAHNALKEHLQVLMRGGALFDGSSTALPGPSLSASAPLAAPLLAHAFHTGGPGGARGADEGLLHVQAGTIPRTMAPAFLRAVHRVTRGNCVVHDVPIDAMLLGVPPEGREPVPLAKNVVLLVYSGSAVHAKVNKMCTHFGATMYVYPEARGARMALHARLEVRERHAHVGKRHAHAHRPASKGVHRAVRARVPQVQLMEMRELLRHTVGAKHKTLRAISANLSEWQEVVSREKATLHTLNLLSFDIRRKVFIAEGWVPTSELAVVRAALNRAAAKVGGDASPVLNVLSTSDSPPTFLRTNKFTQGFQGLVDTYGIPRYQEINPGAFAVVLFPFLFAIMFGDVGHGLLLLLIALFFIANEV